ncbi:XrtA/PEP-CTERM system histidine kinase PrsK [Gayadomonas joobiniege]|uniref:XrtA/PEP-CTERM system histidine kinase PrsK n=1 Tax=Gayadomonas joobiniege TaxID=1234606 RepID=UPI0003698AB9|nr:XrtA/PEP-CTERM system histidine kinase PrsK [Gayadomonas joobiniege]
MEFFHWAGYAGAAFSYLLLSLLALANRLYSPAQSRIILFAAGGVTWAVGNLIYLLYADSLYTSWLESIRFSTSLLLLIGILQPNRSIKAILLTYAGLLPILVLVIPLLGVFVSGQLVFDYIAFLSASIAALVLIEIIYRRSKDSLSEFKPLLIGLGSITVFDFVIFSEASLVAHINPDFWLARGYLHALLIPLLIWTIKRNKSLAVSIYVSREMVFQSSLLLVAALYLSAMAIAGYYIKSIQSQWTMMLQTIFMVLAFTLLFALFVSESLKRNLKVFLEKHFFANQYDYRAQWMALTELLNKPLNKSDSFYHRAIDAFLFASDYKDGVLLKVKNQNLIQVAGSKKNLQHETDENLEAIRSLVPYIQKSHWIIDIKHLIKHPDSYPEIEVKRNLLATCQFSLLIPIFEQDRLWGLACLNPPENNKLKLNWEIRDYLNVVTAQVGHYLFQHEANKIMTENAQFAAFNRTSAFVVHDLKNVLAQIEMILSNAQKHKSNPEFIEDTFETLGYTQKRMHKMLNQLMNKSAEDEKENSKRVYLKPLLTALVENKCQNQLPHPQLTVIGEPYFDTDAEKFSNVLFHLIDNAQQATEDNGKVSVSAQQQNNKIKIVIEDTGVGMTEDFIANKLFMPFVTTKGNAGMGIGAYDAKLFIENEGGELTVTSEIGKGSRFEICFTLNKEI